MNNSQHHRVKRMLSNGNCAFSPIERKGRFAIIEMYHPSGIVAYGIARKSDEDEENAKIAEQVAKHRAAESMLDKLRGRKVRHPLAG